MKNSVLFSISSIVTMFVTFFTLGFRDACPEKEHFEDLATCTVAIKTNVNTSLKMCGTFANLLTYTECEDFCVEGIGGPAYAAGDTFTANVSKNFSVTTGLGQGWFRINNPGSSTIIVSVKKCTSCSTWWNVTLGAGGFQYFGVGGLDCNTSLGSECG